jgi:hypothetical protein
MIQELRHRVYPLPACWAADLDDSCPAAVLGFDLNCRFPLLIITMFKVLFTAPADAEKGIGRLKTGLAAVDARCWSPLVSENRPSLRIPPRL